MGTLKGKKLAKQKVNLFTIYTVKLATEQQLLRYRFLGLMA